jgi:hypothetical protein
MLVCERFLPIAQPPLSSYFPIKHLSNAEQETTQRFADELYVALRERLRVQNAAEAEFLT